MKVNTFEEVRSLLGNPSPTIERKIYKILNTRMIKFIDSSPLLFIASVDERGFPTISPKGDGPGFVRVDDSSTLLIPERKGNKMAITFQNILSGSKVGLLFVVPGTNEILRVHGAAELIVDKSLNRALASESQNAILVTKFTVDHCYFHCGKAFLRSHLFAKDLSLKDMNVSLGRELAGNGALDEAAVDEFDKGVKSRYQTDF